MNPSRTNLSRSVTRASIGGGAALVLLAGAFAGAPVPRAGIAPVAAPAADSEATGGWGAAEQVLPDGAGIARRNFRVAVTAGGAVIAAWIDDRKILSVAWRNASGGWDPPVEIARHVKRGGFPQAFGLATGPDGGAALVWRQTAPREIGLTLYRESHLRHGDWTPAVTLASGNSRWDSPDVVIDGRRVITVAYRFEKGLWLRSHHPRGGWTRPHRLSRGQVSATALATNPAGRVVAAWSDTRKEKSHMRATLRSATGRWGSTRTLLPSTLSYEVLAGIDRRGRALVTFSQEVGRPSPPVLRWVRSTPAAGWTRTRKLDSWGDGFGELRLTMRPAGDAFLSWIPWSGEEGQVRAARYAPGGVWTPSDHGLTGWGHYWSSSWLDADGQATLLAGPDLPGSSLVASSQPGPGAVWGPTDTLSESFNGWGDAGGQGHRMAVLWVTATGALMASVNDSAPLP
jgi:hypothetical protein